MMYEPIAKVVSGYSGDPDTRGNKNVQVTASLADLPVGTILYAKSATDDTIVIITQSRLDQLEARAEWLEALEQAGVDNWDGWDVARDIKAEWDQENGIEA